MAHGPLIAACGYFALGGLVLARTEPGLEEAVEWKWRVAPSDPRQWVVVRPEPTPVPVSATPTPAPVSETYEVKRGDALVLIARKFGLTVTHLKVFNGLDSDMIRIGETLRIPTRDEARAIAPLPTPKPKKVSRKKADPNAPGVTEDQLKTAAVQAFLDRQQFSAGPIDGLRGATFDKVMHLYLAAHPELADPVKLDEAVEAQVGNGFSRYVLTEADFQFIAPPRAARPVAAASEKKPSAASGPTYEDLIREPRLLYRTPWEFVAERFHCEEKFLKNLNTQVRSAPTIGTELRVPNVIPFRMEKIVWETMQPAPEKNITTKAAVMDLSLLQIFQNDRLVAVMPIATARPGLRGRGTWIIREAIPLPRMGTFQEPRAVKQRPKPMFGQPEPETTPVAKALLPAEQFLPPGPNNPVGLAWIQLSKADDPEPLIYGLHGTSIPEQIKGYYSLGGFQMANWNIVRAVRLLPPGAELEWLAPGMMPVRAPAPVAAPAN